VVCEGVAESSGDPTALMSANLDRMHIGGRALTTRVAGGLGHPSHTTRPITATRDAKPRSRDDSDACSAAKGSR
jgi:hypothetical protein